MLSDNTVEKQSNVQEQEIDSDEQKLVTLFLCYFCAFVLGVFCHHHQPVHNLFPLLANCTWQERWFRPVSYRLAFAFSFSVFIYITHCTYISSLVEEPGLSAGTCTMCFGRFYY